MARVHTVIKHFNDYDNFIQELINRIPEDTTDNKIIKEHYRKKLYDLQFHTGLTVQDLRRYGCRRENP